MSQGTSLGWVGGTVLVADWHESLSYTSWSLAISSHSVHIIALPEYVPVCRRHCCCTKKCHIITCTLSHVPVNVISHRVFLWGYKAFDSTL